MLKIRLSRYGKKKNPCYKIVVIDSRKSRNGKFIEKVGFYQPLIKINGKNLININIEKIRFWMKKGCKLSNTVINIIKNQNK